MSAPMPEVDADVEAMKKELSELLCNLINTPRAVTPTRCRLLIDGIVSTAILKIIPSLRKAP